MNFFPQLFLVFVTLVSSSSSMADSWYGKFANGKMSECVYLNQPVAASVAELERTFNSKCEHNYTGYLPVYGYSFRCGPNNNQFMFRSKEICERFRVGLNNNGKGSSVFDFVPRGTKNPNGYVVGFTSCAEKAYTKEAVAKSGYEKLSDYCACNAEMIGTKTEKEMNKDFVAKILLKCLPIINSEIVDNLKKIPN